MESKRNFQTNGVLEHPNQSSDQDGGPERKGSSGAQHLTYPNTAMLPFPSHERNEPQSNSNTITEGERTAASASLHSFLNFAPFLSTSSSLPPILQSHSTNISPDDLARARSHHLHQQQLAQQQNQRLVASAVAGRDLGSSYLHHFQLRYHAQQHHAPQTVSTFPCLSSGGPSLVVGADTRIQLSPFARDLRTGDQQPPQDSRAALPSSIGVNMFPVGGASYVPSFRNEAEMIALPIPRAAPMPTPTPVPISILSQPMQEEEGRTPPVYVQQRAANCGHTANSLSHQLLEFRGLLSGSIGRGGGEELQTFSLNTAHDTISCVHSVNLNTLSESMPVGGIGSLYHQNNSDNHRDHHYHRHPMQQQHQQQPVVFNHHAVPTYNNNGSSAMYYDRNSNEAPHQSAKYNVYREVTVPSASSLCASSFFHSHVTSLARAQLAPSPHISSFTQSPSTEATLATPLSFRNANNFGMPMLTGPAVTAMASAAAAVTDSTVTFLDAQTLLRPSAATSSSLATTACSTFACVPSSLSYAVGINNNRHNHNNTAQHVSTMPTDNTCTRRSVNNIASTACNGGDLAHTSTSSAAFACPNHTSLSQAVVSSSTSISVGGGAAAASFAAFGASHSPSFSSSSQQHRLQPPHTHSIRVVVGAGEGTVMGIGASSAVAQTVRKPVTASCGEQIRKEPSKGAKGNETRTKLQSTTSDVSQSKKGKEFIRTNTCKSIIYEKGHCDATSGNISAKTLLSSPLPLRPSSKEDMKGINPAGMSTAYSSAHEATPKNGLPRNSPMSTQHSHETTAVGLLPYTRGSIAAGVCAEVAGAAAASAATPSSEPTASEQTVGKEKKSSARNEKGVQRISSDDEALLLLTEGNGATQAVRISSLGKKSPLLFRTQLCNFFDRHKFCRFIKTCVFAHGPDELRTVEMNERDGLTTKEALDAFIARGDSAQEEQAKKED